MQRHTIRWYRCFIMLMLALVVVMWKAVDVQANITGTWAGTATITTCIEENLCSGGPSRVGSIPDGKYTVQYTFQSDTDSNTNFHGSLIHAGIDGTFTGTSSGTFLSLTFKYTNFTTHGFCSGPVTGNSMSLTCRHYLGQPFALNDSTSRLNAITQDDLH